MRLILAAIAVVLTALLAGPAPSATSSPSPRSAVAPAASGDLTARLALPTIKKRVIALTNKKRVSHGCGRVRANAALGRAAQKHSNRMAAADTLSHQLPGEPSLEQRYRNEGYRPTWWGENIAWNYPTAKALVNAWMASPGHRANILNCHYKHIGIGLAKNDAGEPYWTQDFGRK